MEIARQTLRPETVTHNCDTPPHPPTNKMNNNNNKAQLVHSEGGAERGCGRAPWAALISSQTDLRAVDHTRRRHRSTAARRFFAHANASLVRVARQAADGQTAPRPHLQDLHPPKPQDTHTHTQRHTPPPFHSPFRSFVAVCLFYSLGGKKFLSTNHQLKKN